MKVKENASTASNPKTNSKIKYDSKTMEYHRAYMKTYRTQGSIGEAIEYKDLYQILNIPREATHSEIRKSYKTLALKYHPDRNSSEEAMKRWEGVPEAYAILSDPNDRLEYDESLPTRDALVVFYQTYNPSKLNNATIQTIIEGWTGKEVELFDMLRRKYEIDAYKDVKKNDICNLTKEQSNLIARDCVESSTDNEEKKNSLAGYIVYMFCCHSRLQKAIGRKYYEVYSESPGVNGIDGIGSHTPGQTPVPNLRRDKGLGSPKVNINLDHDRKSKIMSNEQRNRPPLGIPVPNPTIATAC